MTQPSFQSGLSFARQLDETDLLRPFRERFLIPASAGKEQVYFLGNSLGLQPRNTRMRLQQILDDWASLGVESFFHAGEPWMDYHASLTGTLAEILGARAAEIVVMNQLSVNLHLMMVSFYQPAGKRYKILCEAKAFPSDQYAFETHLRYRGYDPAEALIEVTPRPGEHLLRTEDIVSAIDRHANELALVFFSGINYYTGQLFDLPSITAAARRVGARVGFDLAHAAGNVPLALHDWGVDFACWCHYKYLNAGPGAIGGVFIHERNHTHDMPRFAGWWGYDQLTRFRMEQGFKPMPGAEGWQLSTPSLLLYASLRASLELFAEAGWEAICRKQRKLNDYLWDSLREALPASAAEMFITPADPVQRGSQLSMHLPGNGREVFDRLTAAGFMVDWREPDVIRLAPVPLYNRFEEIWHFANTLREILKH